MQVPNVSLPLSPNNSASGAQPTPALSSTIRNTLLPIKILLYIVFLKSTVPSRVILKAARLSEP